MNACIRLGVTLALFSISAWSADEFPRGPVPKGGEIFRASFEKGDAADAGAGFREMHYAGRYWGRKGWKFVYTKGRAGKALDLRIESLPKFQKRKSRGSQYACFKAQGHICPAVGALSFWFIPDKGAFSVEISTQSNDSWNPPRLLRVGVHRKRLALHIGHRDYSASSMALKGGSLKETWNHMAVVWDQRQGCRVYLNGREVLSKWGKYSYQTGYLSAGRLSLAHGVFDDVRIFDIALTAGQVAALAAGGDDVSGLKPSTQTSVKHRMERLSWNDVPSGHFIPMDGSTIIRRIGVVDARALLISGWRGVDGRQDSVWPLHYHGYKFGGGGALHLRPAPGESFNYVRVVGPMDEAALCEGNAWTRPKDARTLMELKGGRFITTRKIDPRCKAETVSVYPRKDRRQYRTQNKQLHDIALLDVHPGRKSSDPLLGVFTVKPRSPQTVAGDNRVRLIQWYRPEERRVVWAEPGFKHDTPLHVSPYEYLHIMLTPMDKDVALSSVRLNWRVSGWPEGTKVNLRVHDPCNLWRELTDVDVEIMHGGELDLSLDFPPTIVPKGTELWLTLIADQKGDIVGGPGVAIHGPDMAKAKQSYLTWQHRQLKDDFASLSEPRPWGKNDMDDTFLRVALAPYDAISRKVWDLHRRFPTDRWTRGYMLYTHPRSKEYWQSLPIDLPRDPRVPRWALLQKELLKEFLFFGNWWIDNRQAPNGELGNWWGDDTDLVGDWVSFHLIGDPKGKFRRSQRLVADYTWKHMMKNGLNTRHTDALHAYEDGVNVQPYAALMDYGNPVLWERLLATARRYDGHLIGPATNGKRSFRGNYYSDAKVTTKGSDTKSLGRMQLSLHAGLTLMWYNGHPGVRKMFTELFDGSSGMRGKIAGLANALYEHTGDRRFVVRKERYPTTALWVRMLNLKETTPDALKGLIDHKYELGSTTALGNGNYLPLIKYVAWHYTRDKKHLVPALEYLWKQCYYTNYLFTKTEQSGDRVHAHKNLTDFMYFGGPPGSRAHIYPVMAVTYEGFAPDFAGLVVDDTPDYLKWVGFSFHDRPKPGKLRVWRLAPGTYDVRMGVDGNGDDKIDAQAKRLTLDLKRYETIPLTLPSHKLYVVEARCVKRDTPLYQRCDLAVAHEDAVRKGPALTVVAHNLGCRPTGAFTVEIANASGRVIGNREHPGLDGVGDLRDKRADIKFSGLPANGPLTVTLRGPAREITEVNNRAVIDARSMR